MWAQNPLQILLDLVVDVLTELVVTVRHSSPHISLAILWCSAMMASIRALACNFYGVPCRADPI